MQRLIITCVLILFFVSPCFSKRLLATSNTFNVVDYGAKGDGETDDSHAFLSAWKKTCSTQSESTLVIPSKGVFLLKKNIIFRGPCQATNIQIQLLGRINVAVQNAWLGDKSPIILITNVNGLTMDGTGGLIDGMGSSWWACKKCRRPTVLAFNACNGLSVSSLSITNSPQAHITINGCESATFSNINIDSPADSPNTDGIDISSSKSIFIKDSNIASGDDCVAIIGDSSDINATGIACGPGHGISIGSLGRNNGHDKVEQVYVYNCSFTKTTNGARIKTFKGGPGYARNITYEKITLTETYNPILIDQNYVGLESEGGVEVSGVTFRGFEGTSADNRAITLACGAQGCNDIVLDQVNIKSSKAGKPAACSCINAHGTATSTVPNCDGLHK